MAKIFRKLSKSFSKRVDRIREKIGKPHLVKVPVPIPVFRQDLLKGRKALITGGSKGIGLGIAKAFLESGCEVTITGRDEIALAAAVEGLKSIGPSVAGVALDNCRPETFRDAVDKLFAERGEIDVLVNNAGFTQGGGFYDSTTEKYDAVFDSVLKGAWFLSKEFAERWKANHTRANVLNVCSVSSFRPGSSPYIMAKWGERSMTIGLAKLLIPHGIVVNGLAPGLTHIKRVHKQHGGLGEGLDLSKNPSGRLVTVEELANMAVVLVSDLGRMAVGEIVRMGGGAGVVTVDDF